MKRRQFVTTAASAAVLGAVPATAAAQPRFIPRRPRIFTRMEITAFSADPALVQALRNGIQAMKNVTNAQDNRSFAYWHNSHWMASGSPPPAMASVWNQCKHGVPYFYAWHRGYVYYFERMLRTMAATAGPVPANFALPYWDYYKHPSIPAIYASPTYDGGKTNPLYDATRTGTTMSGLDYSPYASTVVNFPTGTANDYEDLVEDNPHGWVHGLIGGDMGNVPTAGYDPIFYLHHCNIDRLWAAWVKADGSRAMPAASDPWWNQSWSYDTAGTWNVSVKTMANTLNLAYTYSDLTLPAKFRIIILRPILIQLLEEATPRSGAIAHGGGVALGMRSVSVALPVATEQRTRLHALARTPNPPPAEGASLVLDGVRLTASGRRGGYAYGVYLNLPATGGNNAADPRQYYVGSVNSFAISTQEMMHGANGVTLVFPLSAALAAQERAGLLKDDTHMTVSFVRTGVPRGASADTQFVTVGSISIVAGAPR